MIPQGRRRGKWPAPVVHRGERHEPPRTSPRQSSYGRERRPARVGDKGQTRRCHLPAESPGAGDSAGKALGTAPITSVKPWKTEIVYAQPFATGSNRPRMIYLEMRPEGPVYTVGSEQLERRLV
ncbi:hypothetical protein NSU_2104 [Novosphingobium pentaromativorans US6-1]|uniref:Uncharacterized protein n=1 Tax=Novosphingobium pentaromativorans US6-1 TaxID=1088721 RepID=G6ECN2_9SPHN|nr:hypothetical protein NSU_2104 [Novosphingobium pentaromativorans US6-1]